MSLLRNALGCIPAKAAAWFDARPAARRAAWLLPPAAILAIAAILIAPPQPLPADALARADALIRREAANSLFFLAIGSLLLVASELARSVYHRGRHPDPAGLVFGPARASAAGAMEFPMVLGLVALLLALNMASIEIYPLVWGDEAGYSDPGINLALGHGLTSSVWFNVYWGQFWYSFPPLFAWLIALWVSVFGVTLASVRALNVVLISLCALALWRYAVRSGLVPGTAGRIAIVLLPLFGYGISFSYRNARPDTLGALIAVLGLNAVLLSNRRWRVAALIAIGFLLPLTAPQLPVFAVALALLTALSSRSLAVSVFAPVAIGIGLGLGALLAFYVSNDGVYGFLTSTFGSVNSTPGQLAQYFLLQDPHGFHDLRQLLWRVFAVVFEDRSSVFLGAAAVVMLLALRHQRQSLSFVFARFAVVAMFSVPMLMQLAGKYSPNYTWMGLLTVGIAVAASLATAPPSRALRQAAETTAGFVALALVVGLPLQLPRAYLNGAARDYNAVRLYVRPHVAAGDWVYVSEQAYFAVAERGAVPVVSGYAQGRLAPGIPEDQRRRIKLFVVHPDEVENAMERLGGSWRQLDWPLALPPLSRLVWQDWGELREPYRLVAYLRR
jgi:hypothetical protein